MQLGRINLGRGHQHTPSHGVNFTGSTLTGGGRGRSGLPSGAPGMRYQISSRSWPRHSMPAEAQGAAGPPLGRRPMAYAEGASAVRPMGRRRPMAYAEAREAARLALRAHPMAYAKSKQQARPDRNMELDWQFYLENYPDLRQNGLRTQQEAEQHYVKHGRMEGRTPNALFKSTRGKNMVFNILMRCTYRPTHFKKCIESVLSQTHRKFTVVMCYDDERCLDYLQKYTENPRITVFKAPEVDKTQTCFYNLYCNFLLEKVRGGWVLFLDDDDMFKTNDALRTIAANINDTNTLLFWKYKRPDRLIYPDVHQLRSGAVASCGYCFHSRYKSMSKWGITQEGDFAYIGGLASRHNFDRRLIHAALTGAAFTEMKLGNYGVKEDYGNEGTLKALECGKPLSIVLLCFNELERTVQCVNSVLRNTLNDDYEFIIVNNGSTDGTREYLNGVRSNKVRIIHNESNIGFSKGMNIGAKDAHGEYIILLDNNTIVGKGWDSELIKTLESDDSIFVVTPVTNLSGNESMVDVQCDNPESFFDRANKLSCNLKDHIQIYSLVLFCGIFRLSDLKGINYLDENYTNGWEADDLYESISALDKNVVLSTKSLVYCFGNDASSTGDASNRERYENKWNKTWSPKGGSYLISENRKYDVPDYVEFENAFFSKRAIRNFATFIIPSCGRHPIDSTLLSLVAQKMFCWTCVIIYDGVAKNHTINDSRITYSEVDGMDKSNPNGNTDLVRNEAMKRIDQSCEWVCFVADSAVITSNYLGKIHDEVQLNNSVDAILFRTFNPNHPRKDDGFAVIPKAGTKNIEKGNVGMSLCCRSHIDLRPRDDNHEHYTAVNSLVNDNFIVCLSPHITCLYNNANYELQDCPKLDENERVYFNNHKVENYLCDNKLDNYYIRNFSIYNKAYYSNIFKDVFSDKDGLFNHFREHGIIEGRQSNFTLINKNDFKPYSNFSKRIFVVYFPQFHEVEVNNRVWGKGWTDFSNLHTTCKDNINVVRPEYEYNLLDYNVRKKHAVDAKKCGIYGFSVYNYYFYGENLKKKVMYKPYELMLKDNQPDIPFYFVWVNETWTRKWEGGTNLATVLQEYHSDIPELEEHFQYLLPYFKHKNYYKFNNKLVFSIYKIHDIPEPKLVELIDYFNRRLRQYCLPEIYLLQCMGSNWEHDKKYKISKYSQNVYETQPNLTFREKESAGTANYSKTQSTKNIYELMDRSTINTSNNFLGFFFHFDNSCRLLKRGHPIKFDFIRRSEYVRFLSKRLLKTDTHLVMNAWNEWGEGMAIEQINNVSNAKIDFRSIIEESIVGVVSKGIAISTYFKRYDPSRLNTFRVCIDSLIKTAGGNVKVYVVDDHSNDDSHLKYLKTTYPQTELYINSTNIGIAGTKNRCIDVLGRNKHDIMFLSDDDVIFEHGWDRQYTHALLKSGVNMLMADVVNEKKKIHNNTVTINDVALKVLTMPEGPFIAMTSKVPKEIGLFDANLIYGYEHTCYSLNCLRKNLMPYNLDVMDSRIKLCDDSYGNSQINSEEKEKYITESIRYLKSKRMLLK